ncbi:MAG: ABC transporter permease, partial [bacterium]
WLVRGATALLVAAMMWRYSGSLTLATAMLAGASAALAAGALGVFALFRALHKLLPALPSQLRAGLRNLLRRRGSATAQTMAFALTIMAMLVVVFIRTELLDAWHRTIPDDAPNHFVLNIQPHDAQDYAQYLREQGIVAGQLYPVVRGRLTRLNDQPMVARVSKEAHDARPRDESLRRDLNLTWSQRVPPDNEILAGAWWQPDAEAKMVSVESELAQRLGIGLGDRLTLFTGDQEWSARVASIRRVQWDNFKPNFYLVFNRAALAELPTTWINSFRLDDDDDGGAGKGKLAPLVKRFPSITLLEVDAILNQIKDIIAQVTLALEAILGFVLAAGVMVTLASVAASLDQRLREGALLRTLGAGRGAIVRSQWSEFAGIGLLAGALGVAGAEIINALLYRRVFDLDYAPTWWAWALIPPAAAALIGLIGVTASRRVLHQSPLASLRRGG